MVANIMIAGDKKLGEIVIIMIVSVMVTHLIAFCRENGAKALELARPTCTIPA